MIWTKVASALEELITLVSNTVGPSVEPLTPGLQPVGVSALSCDRADVLIPWEQHQRHPYNIKNQPHR